MWCCGVWCLHLQNTRVRHTGKGKYRNREIGTVMRAVSQWEMVFYSFKIGMWILNVYITVSA